MQLDADWIKDNRIGRGALGSTLYVRTVPEDRYARSKGVVQGDAALQSGDETLLPAGYGRGGPEGHGPLHDRELRLQGH